LNLELAKKEYLRLFYADLTEEASALLKHAIDMIERGKATVEGRTVEKESDEAKAFLMLEEVRKLQEDEELFNYYFYQMDNQHDWISYYDEPTRKVKYKYEDGLNLVSCLCEALVDAPIQNCLALFSEVDLFDTWFP
jgi:hypothetical protein